MGLTTAKLDIYVNTTCEACGSRFNYSKTLVRREGSAGTAKAAVKRDASQPSEYGYVRCPHCRYMQSWMVKNFHQINGFRIAGIGVLFLTIAFWKPLKSLLTSTWEGIDNPSIWQIVFAIVGFLAGVVGILYCGIFLSNLLLKPNGKWEKSVPPDNRPKTKFSPAPSAWQGQIPGHQYLGHYRNHGRLRQRNPYGPR